MLREKKRYLKNHNRYNNREENNNTININVKNTEDLFSPFQEDEASIITDEFAETLKKAAQKTNPKKVLNIKISGIKNIDRPKVVKSIKNYFYHELAENERENRSKNFLSLICFAIGLLFLVATLLTTKLIENEIIPYVLDIFCWVFIWEAVDIFSFTKTHIKHEIRRNLSFVTANIIFL